ncbi:MAG: hypothetical protein APF81_07775 [Desulfosporosinus sp. BRH_c37]|nr:MAG: hypothetical protein APF81_07775 [Desulfosporosinus sp. BRH_c37]
MWLAHTFASNACNAGSRVALKEGNRAVTYQELNQRTDALLAYLQSIGIKQGERVAVLSKNSIEVIETYVTCYKSGLIYVPVNYRLPFDKLEYILSDCDASVLVVSPEFAEFARTCAHRSNLKTIIMTKQSVQDLAFYDDLVALQPADSVVVEVSDVTPAAIIYTSGTTGLPKGVILSHRALLEAAKIYMLELGIEPKDRTLNIMPLFHSGGNAWTLAHLCRGATGVVMPDFEAKEVLKVMTSERITTVHLVPTMIAMLLEEEQIDSCDWSLLKVILYAGSPMPQTVLKKAMGVFGAAKLAQAYGQTEHAPTISYLTREEHVLAMQDAADEKTKGLLKSCGRPIFNVSVRIMKDGQEVPRGEVGEITAQGESIMIGYWRKPDLTAAKLVDGWLHTGDLGKMDEDGYIYLLDRKEDMIITGGENVFPTEVEGVIYEHPAVHEVAVIGEHDEMWGERVAAVVLLRKGFLLTEEELLDWLRPRIQGYARPRCVYFVETLLPKSGAGKVLRKEVKILIS